ncbi:MAG: 3'-5' exonuclease, partial [Phycisphaerae bacterium]|nr:3'-5' exonuclease [Phycisphaerae bacterium]
GKHLRAIQEALAERGVPAVIQAGESVFITAEAHAVRFVLHGLLNPDNQGAVFAALQTPIFGLCAGELEKVRTEESKFSHWVRKFGDWGQMLQRDGFLVTWRRILDAQASLSRLAGQVLGERRIANYSHIGELLHNWALEAHAGPIELLGWLESSMADAEGNDKKEKLEENQIRLESDAEAVQLCTIHASKGLEYPIVYCPTLWDVYGGPAPVFVIARHDKERKLLDVSEIDVGSGQFDERLNMDKEQSEKEDRRNLYVALTRAVHQCRVYWTSATGSEESAMGRIMGFQSDKLDDGEINAGLQKWVGSLDTEHVQLRSVGNPAAAADPTSYVPSTKTDTELSARLIRRKQLSSLDQTSFTALSRTIVAAEDVAMADRDDVSQAVDEDKGGLTDLSDGRLISLADMPGGRKVGVLVHSILEDLLGDTELTGRDGTLVTQAASVLLERHLPRVQLGMSWRDKLANTLSQCLTGTILDVGEGFRLIDLPHDDLAVEMPFLLRSGRRNHPVKFDQFADAFKHSGDPAVRRYADRARRINRSDLAGFLSGFIDLTFTWSGRWYLLDYKSNNLGPKMADYAPNSLTRAMTQHDYMLQYHLYAVALHLLLGQRLAGYDYERDFGGAVYLYLRGFDPTGASRRGVYFNRPDFAVIDALTKALLGEDAA